MMRRHGLGWVLLGLGLSACTSNTPPKDPNERTAPELYVLKAIQYMESGRIDIAQQDLKHAIELDEHNVEAHNALGVLYERLKMNEEAEAEFKRAQSLDENNDSVAVNYGRVLCAQGKYEQGMKHLRKAIDSKLYQTPWLALTNAGLCAKYQGQNEEAEGYYRKALETNPDFSPALLEMAKLSLSNGNNLSARAFLQRYGAAVEQPTADALALGIQVEQALGNHKDADAYLKKLLRFFPDSKEASVYRNHKSHTAH